MKSAAWTRSEGKNEEVVFKSCTHCGLTKPLDLFYTTGKKVDGSPKYNSWCKKCILIKQTLYHKQTWGKEKLQYTAFKRTKSARSYLQYLRSKATQRVKGSEVISLDALELLWHTQNGCCALTGWQMTMELGNGVVSTNCSIDRIDSKHGYVVGNVQLVCRAANIAKSNLVQSDFVQLCKAVLENSNA
jgi:hypothetical protein